MWRVIAAGERCRPLSATMAQSTLLQPLIMKNGYLAPILRGQLSPLSTSILRTLHLLPLVNPEQRHGGYCCHKLPTYVAVMFNRYVLWKYQSIKKSEGIPNSFEKACKKLQTSRYSETFLLSDEQVLSKIKIRLVSLWTWNFNNWSLSSNSDKLWSRLKMPRFP